MDKDEFNKDDLLGKLISQSSLESPSDDFVERVMAGISLAPDAEPAKKPFFHSMRSGLPYVFLVLLFVLVFATSDLPFLQWIPGKNYFSGYFMPYFEPLIGSLKSAFSSKFVSFGLMIAVSGGLLFLVDRLFSRRMAS